MNNLKMGFKLSYVFTFVIILTAAILTFQSFIQGFLYCAAISHEDSRASPKNRVYWVFKMRSWMRDEARQVPTGPDPLHHHSYPPLH